MRFGAWKRWSAPGDHEESVTPLRSLANAIAHEKHTNRTSGCWRGRVRLISSTSGRPREIAGMTDVSRRKLMKATAAVGAAMLPPGLPRRPGEEDWPICSAEAQEYPAATPAAAPSIGAPAPHQAPAITYIFFNTEEAAFIEAAVSRLIPADEKWPGALEAAVPNYVDKQLAGAWGAGERLYRSGPWQQGTPSQGYQLPFTPAQLFHTSIAAINNDLAQTC